MSIALKHIKERRFIKNTLPCEIKDDLAIGVTTISQGEANETVESIEGLKFWEMVFNRAPTLTEYELVNVLLRLEGLDENASNNTKMLNKIFKASNEGYIKQTSLYSHVWELALKK